MKKQSHSTRKSKNEDKESMLLSKIAQMPEKYQEMGERLHNIIMNSSPALAPRLWYDMPAYALKGKVICFFRGDKNERYMTLGFNENAALDEGNLWPTSYALLELSHAEEEKISILIKKAVRGIESQ
ncbi:DUF1801 domain-containing protein [Methanobacterium movens]|nr:MAG: hypothetical protein CIT03_07660 [Methanobacterium sp.]